MEQTKKIVIVGSGIVGSSIALNLYNNRGSQKIHVCVIDSQRMEDGGGAGGATSKSWAWLNANQKSPRHYKDLNIASMRLWQLEPEVVYNGNLVLSNQPMDNPTVFNDPVYPGQKLSPEESICIEPNLNPELKVSNRFLFPQEGLVDAVRYTESLWRKAQKHGATFMFGKTVAEIIQKDSQVTGVKLDSGETIPCDVLVLATGCDTPEVAMLAGVEVPMLDRPGLLAHTHPLPLVVHRVILADDVYILQRPDGSVVIGDDMSSVTTVGENEKQHMEYARLLLQKATNYIPALSQATIRSAEIGHRPYPADGLPVCGYVSSVKSLYLAVTHSGVTLAPILGLLISKEIIENRPSHLLEPYRLEGRDFGDDSNTYDIQYHGWSSQQSKETPHARL